VNLVDINRAFRVLDQYGVAWVILQPMQPLAKALAWSGLWDEVYSDKSSIVFVRRRWSEEVDWKDGRTSDPHRPPSLSHASQDEMNIQSQAQR
jgi:hypothetical protein